MRGDGWLTQLIRRIHLDEQYQKAIEIKVAQKTELVAIIVNFFMQSFRNVSSSEKLETGALGGLYTSATHIFMVSNLQKRD